MYKYKFLITLLIFLSITFVLEAKVIAFDMDTIPEDDIENDTIAKPYGGWGSIDPGKGFLLAKTKLGTINVSAYVLTRYINQLPGTQSYIDHLGRVQTIDPRNDIQLHRILLTFMGYIYLPKFNYVVTAWTVNSTQQVAIVGALTYSFNKRLELSAGIIGNAGTRSLLGSHPYWLAPDRVMADEFFRPGFTSGVWATGELLPRFYYKAMLGNNISQLGISATKLTRSLTPSGSIWWLPTTGEFGPRGGYGDYEHHKKLATRFGACITHSRDNRFSDLSQKSPDNTQIRISDGLLFFQTGSLADGVTVQEANFDLLAMDAGIKYKGLFLQTEWYYRKLSKFLADGPLPISTIIDKGFYVQLSYMVIPKRFELYTATSRVYGQFRNSHEYVGGANYFPVNNRNLRVNAHVIRVFGSPTGSTFGYYVAGQTGTTLSLACSVFF